MTSEPTARRSGERERPGGRGVRVADPVVVHWTQDMPAAIEFYRDVFGLTVVVDDPVLAVLDLPPIRLLLHLVDPVQPERPLRNAGLNVAVDNLDAAIGLVARHGGRVEAVRAPAPPAAFRIALCRDADGNAFELRERST